MQEAAQYRSSQPDRQVEMVEKHSPKMVTTASTAKWSSDFASQLSQHGMFIDLGCNWLLLLDTPPGVVGLPESVERS